MLYRLCVFAKYLLQDQFAGKKTSTESLQYFFFVNGMHFQQKTSFGLVIDKAEHWLRLLDNEGITGSLIINPFRVRPAHKTSRDFITLEKVAFICFFKYFLFPRKELFIEKCDSDQILKRNFFNKLCVQTYFEFFNKNEIPLVLGIGLTPSLCLVAKFYGIRTIEFQHGSTRKSQFSTIGVSHSAPEYEFVWDSYFTTDVTNTESLIVIGYPRKFSTVEPQGPTPKDSSKKRFLVSLSYDEPNSIDPEGMVNPVLYEAIKKLVEDDYKITVRPHPVSLFGLEVSFKDKNYFKRFKSWFNSDEVMRKTLLDGETPIVEALFKHDIHLTYSSSVVAEASYLGVPSFLLGKHEEVDDFMLSLIRYGSARFSSPESILDDLNDLSEPLQYQNSLNEKVFLNFIRNSL